jgi:hypothetical protein
VVSQADAAVHDHVAVLRDRAISWTRIGEALGVSKQAAWGAVLRRGLTAGLPVAGGRRRRRALQAPRSRSRARPAALFGG